MPVYNLLSFATKYILSHLSIHTKLLCWSTRCNLHVCSHLFTLADFHRFVWRSFNFCWGIVMNIRTQETRWSMIKGNKLFGKKRDPTSHCWAIQRKSGYLASVTNVCCCLRLNMFYYNVRRNWVSKRPRMVKNTAGVMSHNNNKMKKLFPSLQI